MRERGGRGGGGRNGGGGCGDSALAPQVASPGPEETLRIHGGAVASPSGDGGYSGPSRERDEARRREEEGGGGPFASSSSKPLSPSFSLSPTPPPHSQSSPSSSE